jgi:hypothetical protein
MVGWIGEMPSWVTWVLGVIGIVGTAGTIRGLARARYFWTHESPKLLHERELREKKTSEEFQATQEATARTFRETQEAMIQKFGEMLKATVASEVQKALENDRKAREPDKLITAEERKQYAEVAQASALFAVATLHDPIVLTEYNRMLMDRTVDTPLWVKVQPPDAWKPPPKEEPPNK